MTAITDSQSLGVALRATGHAEAVQRAALAAVPGRFHLADGAAEVVVLDAVPGRWPAMIDEALAEGFGGVIVAGRAAAPLEEARDALGRAAAAGVPVLLDTPFARAEAWEAARDTIAADVTDAGVFDSVVTWVADAADQAGAASAALLDQLAVVRPLLGDLGAVQLVHWAPGGYEITGEAGPVVTLTGVCAPASAHRLDLDVVSTGPHWRVRFDTGAPARPVTIERMDAEGIHAQALRFESAARATWAHLYNCLTGVIPVVVDTSFLGDLEAANRLLGTKPGE